MIPAPVGPYSPAREAGGWVFVSGQIALGASGELASGGVEAQARACLKNLAEVLKEQGLSLKDVVKTTIYLADMGDFPTVNEVYAEFFLKPYPARATVAVKALPKGASVEIEAIAFRT